MTSTATMRWLGLALLGIAVAAGVAIAASNLAGQQIGLSSEPISAGDALAPVASSHEGHGSTHPGAGRGKAVPTTPTTPAPHPETPTSPTFETRPPPEAGDDSGGGGHGDSGGSGGSGADD
jgi:hypothetical protein